MAAMNDIQVAPGVHGRTFMTLDERGLGLRATWHPARGFINVSLWRADRCVETFHLSPLASSDLTAFIVRTLASSIPEPTQSRLRVVRDGDSSFRHRRLNGLLPRVRRKLAEDLEALARRLNP